MMIRSRGNINSPKQATSTKSPSTTTTTTVTGDNKAATPKSILAWIRRILSTPIGILCLLAILVLLLLSSSSNDRPSSTSSTSSSSEEYNDGDSSSMSSILTSALRATTTTTTTRTASAPPESMKSYHQRAYISNELVQKAITIRSTCIEHVRSHHDRILKPLLERSGNPLFDFEAESILLVDPAYHSNIGDHMLTVAEQIYLQKLGWTSSGGSGSSPRTIPGTSNEVMAAAAATLENHNNNNDKDHHPHVECHYVQSNYLVPDCTPDHLRHISKMAKVAMWHAGGNWGDLWRDAQDVRLNSMNVLLGLGFVVVGMPQSLYYKDNLLRDRDVFVLRNKIKEGLKLNETYSDAAIQQMHSKLILTWREQESYQQAKELYPYARNELVPDIAFQLGPYQPVRRSQVHGMVDILLFLRGDLESQVKEERSNTAIRHLLRKHQKRGDDTTFRIVDWDDRLELLEIQQDYFTNSSIELLSMGKVVIADRLHAAILAYLSGLPFVYLDQVSQKLTRTLGVAFNSWRGCQDTKAGMYVKATSLPDAVDKAMIMLEEYNLR